eukprot:5512518-Alexandrium_andersonii.AAC.1
MVTDLQPHAQAAAIVLRLGGPAREYARQVSVKELTNGGAIGGVPLDPVSYKVAGLQSRFAQLDDEARLAAATQLQAFARHQHESINATLARFDLVRNRAATEGSYIMSHEGYALQLLKACNASPTQMIQFLQPFQGRRPTTEQEFL